MARIFADATHGTLQCLQHCRCHRQNLLFLKPLRDELQANWHPMHRFSIIAIVSSLAEFALCLVVCGRRVHTLVYTNAAGEGDRRVIDNIVHTSIANILEVTMLNG